MSGSPLDRHGSTPAELKARFELDRAEKPYLVYRDGGGRQVLHGLDEATGRVVVGRGPAADVVVAWDEGVSWTHAVLERLGDDWLIDDDGVSTNGTYVNDVRIAGRRRLRAGDRIRVGATVLAFQAPQAGGVEAPSRPATQRADEPPEFSHAQRRVLVALCRPYVCDNRAYPATNREIAAELHVSVPTVKGHLRTIGRRFAVDTESPYRRRAAILDRALDTGAVDRADYE
jgi:hypothetical protein